MSSNPSRARTRQWMLAITSAVLVILAWYAPTREINCHALVLAVILGTGATVIVAVRDLVGDGRGR